MSSLSRQNIKPAVVTNSVFNMASNHGTTVIKNLCYTAPRHPRTNKPATENERARSSLEAEPLENDGLSDFSERKLPSSRRHKKHHQGHKTKVSVRESLSHSLRELDGVDEENFYEHLLALKNEHKKSLKALEKLYYSEKDKRDNGFELDSKTKIAVRDFDESRVQEHFPLRDYNPFLRAEENDEKEGTAISVRPEDCIRDMSIREHRTKEDKENEGNNIMHHY